MRNPGLSASYAYGMSNADASEVARMRAMARWGDRVLIRSAATVLERAELTPMTRRELEQITGKEGE